MISRSGDSDIGDETGARLEPDLSSHGEYRAYGP